MKSPVALTGIVLAAGLSRRAGEQNKLLFEIDGEPLVRRVARALLEADLAELLVVTGHERGRVEAVLEDLPVRFVFAEDFARGMGASLAAGVRAACPTTNGFLVTVGDLPGLRGQAVRRVTAAFDGHRHVVPLVAGRRGHPVVLGKWIRPALEVLDSDIGARAVLQRPAEAARTRLLEMEDPGLVDDLDTV